MQRPRRVVGRPLVAGVRDGGADTLLVGEHEPDAVVALREPHIDPDPPIRARLLQQLAECLIVVAEDLGAHLEARHALRQQ